MASGLVLTYDVGIFNRARRDRVATAYLYYQLNTGVGIPIVPSVIICAFIFAPLLGLLLDRILLRRLAKAPVYARIVGTIGLLVMLPALVQWFVVALCIDVFHWDLPGNTATNEGIPVPGIGPTPPNYYNPFGGVVLSSDQLAVFIVAAVSAVVLWYVIRRTRLGLEMRAVVDREPLAGLRGVNAARTSAAAWVMTMVLAGLGGILIAPLFTLTDFVYTLVVLGALAVVVLGRLRSIPIAFIGGLGLGVVQNLVAGYSDDILPKFLSDLSGLKAAVPFILTVILLLVLGRERGRRAGSVADDVPRPDHRRGMSAMRRRLPWVIWTIILLVYTQQWLEWSWIRAGTYEQTVIAQGLAVAIIFLSFVVVTGMGGMVSLAQATFVTAGGFAAGWALSRDWGFDIPGIATNGQINFLWAALIGAVVAGAVGFVIALPMTKLGGVYLALGTLSIAFIAALVVFPIDSIRNNEGGWSFRQPAHPASTHLFNFLTIGDQKTIDLSQLSVQVLPSSVCSASDAVDPLQRSARRASSRCRGRAEASGIREPHQICSSFSQPSPARGVMLGLSLPGQQLHRAARRVVLARARRHLRNPPPAARSPASVLVLHRGAPRCPICYPANATDLVTSRTRAIPGLGAINSRRSPMASWRSPVSEVAKQRPAAAAERAAAPRPQAATDERAGRRSRQRPRRNTAGAPVLEGIATATSRWSTRRHPARARQGRGAARRERRRQVDVVRGRRRSRRAHVRIRAPRRRRGDDAGAVPTGPQRRPARARDARHLPGTHGRREPHGVVARGSGPRKATSAFPSSAPQGNAGLLSGVSAMLSLPAWPIRRGAHRRRADAGSGAAPRRHGAGRARAARPGFCGAGRNTKNAEGRHVAFMELGHIVWMTHADADVGCCRAYLGSHTTAV
jgi:branched-subunit amino acid ABC-type transport system permease component